MTAHTDIGAYSMGLLEEQDKRAFEDHLAGCPACAAELAELSPMAALLRGVELRGVELRGVEPPLPPAPIRTRGRSPSSSAGRSGSASIAGAGRSRWARRPVSC